MNSSYTQLEGGSLQSLGVTAPSFGAGTDVSFFATTSFLYTLFFVAIIGASFYRYMVAGILRMQASDTAIRQSNDIIKKTTLGLLGVFSLFLILVTFNKDLVTGDVGLGSLAIKRGATTAAPPVTTPPATGPTIPRNNDDPVGWGAIQNDPVVRTQLASLPSGGISVNKRVCINPTQTSCTTVGGLHSGTLTMLAELRNACSGTIAITGGSENGHSSHGVGKTPVDLSLNSPGGLEACIRLFPVGPNLNYCRKTYQKFGYTFCDELGVRHWHVFK